MIRQRKRWRLGAATLGAVLALVALAGCGGSDPADATGGVATASGGGDKASKKTDAKRDPQQAGLDWARCMREHGVDVPDPQSGGDGFIRIGPAADAAGAPTAGTPIQMPAGFEEADKECRHFLDDLIQDGAGTVDPEEQDRALKFAQCMREHGVNMPDPDFSNGGISIRIGGDTGINPDSQTVQEAHKACQEFFGPAGGAGGRGGAGAGAVAGGPGVAIRGGGRP
jgi:hypothetical protein